MARRIGYVEHEGEKVPLYLDMKSLKFSAEYGGVILEDRDGASIRQRVIATINAHAKTTYKPVIRLMVTGASRADGISLSVDRFYVSDKGDHKVNWDAYRGGSKRRNTLGRRIRLEEMPYTRDPHLRRYVYLPYSDETWEAVRRLEELVTEIGGQLYDMVGDTDFLESRPDERLLRLRLWEGGEESDLDNRVET